MLQIKNLSLDLSNKTILHNIACSFQLGEITALLGPNGAGKTTLLKSIIGLIPINEITEQAQIIWEQSSIKKLSPHKRIALGIAYLPQYSALFNELTVYDNLRLIYDHHHSWQKRQYSDFNDQMDRWLETTTLQHTLKLKAGNLSGGQKRKLEIVRSVLMEPKLLLCDEPFAGVDPKSIYELKKIFSMLTQRGVGVVISDHHVDQLLSIAKKVFVILEGTVVAKGTPEEILEDIQTRDHYLGFQFHREMSEKFSSD